MFVDVDDGGGWATGGRITDCIDSRGRVAGGMMYVNLVCPPSAGRPSKEMSRASAEPLGFWN